jgi:hypothetical protein
MSASSAACAVWCRGSASSSPAEPVLGEADHREGVTDLTGAGPLVIERSEKGTGLAGHPEAGLGGQQPAGRPGRQRLRVR